MKAAAYEGNRTITVGESTPISPRQDEVRLDVAYCGICGTDMHIFHGHMDQRVRIPQIIGHEVSAEVADIGEEVGGFSVGDRVAVLPLKYGEAAPSDKGFAHVGKGVEVIGVDLPGGMQGSWTVPAYTLHKLPQAVSLEHGAMIEPAAVACHDVRLGEVKEGENCVVIGGGPIGLLIALVAREKGARVILSEVNDARNALAESLGLRAINPLKIDLAATVADETGEAMADIVFEVSGSQSGVEVMTEVVNVRGRIVMVAIHPEPRSVHLFRFFWSELRMIGVRLYEPEDFEEAIDLIARQRLPLDHLITRIDPIDGVQKVFETIDASPDGIKYLIKCDG